MTQETTNNQRNDGTMAAKKPNEDLQLSKDPTNNNFVSSDADNCINNIRKPEKKECQKTSKQSQQIAKKCF